VARARHGIDGLEDDLLKTESLQFRGRSLSYVRALEHLRQLVAEGDPVVAQLERVWAQRDFHAYFSRPFLLLASLRAEALGVAGHPLARGFATHDPHPFTVTRQAILAALEPNRVGVWVSLATRSPQTNEVSRAVVWRWPAALAGASKRTRPLALVDIGASGGLNLIGDRLSARWEDGGGAPLSVAADLDVRLRVGFDSKPLNFTVDEDIAWGRACLWPGAVERVERFEKAVAAWRSETSHGPPPEVHKLNASLVPARLPKLLAKVPGTTLTIAYQTLLAEYMDPGKRKQYEEGMRHWLARQAPGRAMWVEGESGPDRPSASIGILAHVPDGRGAVRSINLGWTGVHPATVYVHSPGATELAEYFAKTVI
jgi:hypothetical protein